MKIRDYPDLDDKDEWTDWEYGGLMGPSGRCALIQLDLT